MAYASRHMLENDGLIKVLTECGAPFDLDPAPFARLRHRIRIAL